MNWDEDVDLLAGKKSATKHGRRTSNARTPGSPEEIQDGFGSKSPPEVPIRTRKTGGWADEGSKSTKGKGSNIIEQERFQNEKSQESEDDIPVIPDIDDVADDPLNLPDVKIPNVTVKESTYKELDTEFESGQSNFGNLGDIDLSFLTSKLYPEKEVRRCTEVWTMESLYQDLAKQ
ncbi:intraflagellar transport protein 43 -like protein [Asbolus verrucosus]|uniref:Intraflagellar transport protein 43-like protein n=1 Tax=Asbolus verrucosus TaxID=1661398 RepID=A0A482W8I0_ASBVE|nr:intraflagellar transport protein 43 -like protein [Asbolus verrucosus]